MRRRSFCTALGLALASPVNTALAQGGKAIRMVVPLPAGTSNDYAARVLSAPLAQLLGQTIVVDNKAGANGAIATMDVVRAAPDGLTLLCGSLSPLATNVAFVKNLPYDPRKDLTPIAGATLTNHVLMVKADSPIRTFTDFLGHAKKRPGELTVGSSTTIVQLQIATMNRLGGVELRDIPYRGTPATISDMIGGVLDATLTDPGNALSQVKGGTLRALAVTSLKRNPATPEWPAIAETLPGFDFSSWNAFVGPVHMSRDIVQRISAAIAQVQARPDVIDQLARSATQPLTMGPDQLKAYMDDEVAKYIRLAREVNLQPV